MELTDRERRILAELEDQFRDGTPEPAARPARPGPRRFRPGWTVAPAAVLGTLLLAAGVVLRVAAAVLTGTVLVLWWLWPVLWRLLCRTGRFVLESMENSPPHTRP